MRIDLQLVLIAIGGSLGAVSRFGIAELAKRLLPGPFPMGTLAANLLGCYLIGLLMASQVFEKHDAIRLGVGVGFLGALTTFSTFGAETMKCLQDEQWFIGLANVAANLLLGLLFVFLGMLTAKRLF